jgi:hypothetical protein
MNIPSMNNAGRSNARHTLATNKFHESGDLGEDLFINVKIKFLGGT